LQREHAATAVPIKSARAAAALAAAQARRSRCLIIVLPKPASLLPRPGLLAADAHAEDMQREAAAAVVRIRPRVPLLPSPLLRLRRNCIFPSARLLPKPGLPLPRPEHRILQREAAASLSDQAARAAAALAAAQADTQSVSERLAASEARLVAAEARAEALQRDAKASLSDQAVRAAAALAAAQADTQSVYDRLALAEDQLVAAEARAEDSSAILQRPCQIRPRVLLLNWPRLELRRRSCLSVLLL